MTDPTDPILLAMAEDLDEAIRGETYQPGQGLETVIVDVHWVDVYLSAYGDEPARRLARISREAIRERAARIASQRN